MYIQDSVITDSLGNEAEVGVFGGLKVSMPTSQVSLTFCRPLDLKKDVTVGFAGAGTAKAQVNRSLLEVRSNGNGSASVTTKRPVRYKSASTIETYFTASFGGTYGAGDSALIGLFDDSDGIYMGMQGTDFVVGYRNVDHDGSGTAPDVVQVVDMSAYEMDKIHRYRFKFGYLGVGDISFEVYKNRRWHKIHIFETDGTLKDRTHIGTPILPMRAEVSSLSNDVRINSGSWNAQAYAKEDGAQDKGFVAIGDRVVNPDSTNPELPLAAFRSKTEFAGYKNKVRSRITYMDIATGSEGLYEINFYAYPEGTILDGNWEDVEANSVLQRNNSTNYDGYNEPVFRTFLATGSQGTGVSSVRVNLADLGIFMSPGDEILMTKKELVGGGGNHITSWNIRYSDLV